jgi:acetate kinase
METILVVNARSSSLKFQVFALGARSHGLRFSMLSRDAARALVSENVARQRFDL